MNTSRCRRINRAFDSPLFKRLPIFLLVTISALVLQTVAAAALPEQQLKQFNSRGYMLGFMPDAMYIASRRNAVAVSFVDANPVVPQSLSSGPSLIKVSRPVQFSNISYLNLWEGIDLKYDQGNGVIRSTYTLEPGAVVEDIRLKYNVPLSVDKDGTLKLKFTNGSWSESPPIAWQDISGNRELVQISFIVNNQNELGFDVGEFNPAYPLVIDPTQ